MTIKRNQVLMVAALALVLAVGCAKKKPPVARPTTPPGASGSGTASGGATPVTEPNPVPPEPVIDDSLASRDIGDINKNSPFQPIFFAYDSS